MRKQLFAALFLLLAFVAAEAQKSPEKQPSPDFKAVSLSGKEFNFSDLKGKKVIVLNFWGYYCPPCRTEIPKLNEVVLQFSGKDVLFLAPTVGELNKTKAFLKKHPFKYEIIPNAGEMVFGFAPKDESGRFEMPFPSHYVIDLEGKIDFFMTGEKAVKELPKVIEKLLKK